MKRWESNMNADPGDRDRAFGAPGRGSCLWILAAAVLAALAAVSLSGCGDISLLNNLAAEDQALPLELGPEQPYLPVKTAITLSVYGGVAPFSYALTGPGALIQRQDTSEEANVTYLAPEAISGDQVSATVEVTDFFGKGASLAVTAYRPLTVDPAQSFFLYRDTTRDLFVSGGVRPYAVTPAAGSGAFVGASTYRYVPPPAGATDTVEILDDLGNRRLLTVAVADRPVAGEIVLTPPEARVGPGESVSFVVTGGTPPYDDAYSGGGTILWDRKDVEGSTVTYTAPGAAGTEAVPVTDSGTPQKSAVFSVEVLGPPSPLTVAFNGDPPTAPDEHIPLTSGQTILVEVSGGVQPYSFEVLADDPRASGTIAQLDADASKALYTAPTIPKVPPLFERIKVGDSNGGETVVQQVKVMP